MLKKPDKLGCRKLGDAFNNGERSASNILENKRKLGQQLEQFHDKSKRRSCHGKYKIINGTLNEW